MGRVPEATLDETLSWLRLQSKPVLGGLASERHLAVGDVQDGNMLLFYDRVRDFDGSVKIVSPDLVKQALERYQNELGCGEGKKSTSGRCRNQITDFPVTGKRNVFIRQEIAVDETGQMGRIDVSIIRKESAAKIALRLIFHKN